MMNQLRQQTYKVHWLCRICHCELQYFVPYWIGILLLDTSLHLL